MSRRFILGVIMVVMHRGVRSLSNHIGLVFCLGLFLLALPFAVQASSVLVRVDAGAYADVDDIEAINTIDYGAFVLLELAPESLTELKARGVEFERQRDPGSFQIQGRPIDTTAGPSAPGGLNTAALSSEPGFYLVQLAGPAKDEWIDELHGAGIDPLRYFNPYVYLVRGSAGQAAAAGELDFVRWVGPYLPEYRISSELQGRTGPIENVDVSILAAGVDGTVAAIEALGGSVVDRESDAGSDGFLTVTFVLPDSALESVSGLNGVSWLSYRPPVDELEDEMSDQIISGNFGPITTGYQAWLTNAGVNGSGITIGLIDSGYDTGVDGTSHPDLTGRLIMVGVPTDNAGGSGHGTHVGGIMAGNASLGTMDGSNYLLGLGVAPQANLVVRVFSGSDSDRQKDVVTRGAIASNNSYKINDAGTGYSARDSALDSLVRDADQSTGALEPMTIVFSAGNSGLTGPTKNAKNIIAVGNSRNERNGDGSVNTGVNIDSLAGGSSRGPAADGRTYPHVSAPGSSIISTRTTALAIPPPEPPERSCEDLATGANAPGAHPTYSMCSGTSMAAPHVTGSVALITQWWNGFNGGANPSPAMNKALLVNGAVDMGAADIPNNNEGWGRINLANVINTGIPTEYVDQTTVFVGTGNSWTDTFSPANQGQQVKVTVTWSDAPAAGGSNPALVNDIDLVVTDATNTFRGNVFNNGLSTTGGSADALNNLENVYLQNPADSFAVTITAAGINGDGIPGNGDVTDQDFALVCTNCVPNEPPACDANGPYVAECSVDIGLDGTGSSDPDNDPLTYEWSGPFSGSPTSGATPIVQFPSPTGAKSVDLEVNDGLASGFCAAPVTVQDTIAPTVTVPADITAECSAPEGTPVDIGLATALDICDVSPTIANDAPALFQLGDTDVTWTGTDDDGNVGMDVQTITIEDTIPPEITVLELSPNVLWPPNHKYVTVTAIVEATDICDADPEITLVSVVSNEPDNAKGNGDGNTTDDIVIVDDFTIQLRAERAGKGSGREYTVTYQAEDDSGNVTQGQAIVTVPKSQGK